MEPSAGREEQLVMVGMGSRELGCRMGRDLEWLDHTNSCLRDLGFQDTKLQQWTDS